MFDTAKVLLCFGLLCLVACQSTERDSQEYTRARFLIESRSTDGYSAMVTLPLSRVSVPVEGQAIVSEFDFLAIELSEVDLGKCLVFTLKPAAARAFYQISVANQGKRLVLMVNGVPLGARSISGPIADGRIFVFLEMDDKQLQELATKLKETNFDIQKKLTR